MHWERERTKHREDRSLEGRIQAYTEMIGLLQSLHGPNEIRLRMRSTVVSAADFHFGAPDEDGLRARWKKSTADYNEMRNAMRRDLGVDSADPGI